MKKHLMIKTGLWLCTFIIYPVTSVKGMDDAAKSARDAKAAAEPRKLSKDRIGELEGKLSFTRPSQTKAPETKAAQKEQSATGEIEVKGVSPKEAAIELTKSLRFCLSTLYSCPP